VKRFEPFHGHYPKSVRAWVNARRWTKFREIQRLAIESIPIDPDSPIPDLVLEAETSSGKTEAAFLPLMARLENNRQPKSGFAILYVSPLRALINDQMTRIGPLAEAVSLKAHGWHSDIKISSKKAARATRSGVLLTTPESLEAFAIGASEEGSMFDALTSIECVVIDELHAFFDSPRGRHLQSLLHRLELLSRRKIPRIGLSATLGDADRSAAAVLRPEDYAAVKVIRSSGEEARPATIRLRAFVDPDEKRIEGDEPAEEIVDLIARRLIEDFSADKRGLVFANSRATVEHLVERCQAEAGPTGIRFEPHHSSIPAADRRKVEDWMRGEGTDAPARMVVVATNTLELGIDIGRVERVVQIDPTFTVSALRQRVGRSGRRGDSHPTGLLYLREGRVTEASHPLDRLRLRTFQSAATAQLSMEGQFEQPNAADLQLSTLFHQVISWVRQATFATTAELYDGLIESGPWRATRNVISPSFFARFLETMATGESRAIEVVETSWQLADTPRNKRHAFTVFSSPPEYIVSAGGVVIGRLPMTVAYRVGDTFVLNRGRWRVVNVSDERRALTVTKAPTAGAPRFGGSPQTPSGVVNQRMLQLYRGKDVSALSEETSFQSLVDEGRQAFRDLKLDTQRLLVAGKDVLIFPWRGARALTTLTLMLRREGLRASASNFAVLVEGTDVGEVVRVLGRLESEKLPELDELAREARQLRSDRFDRSLIPYHQRLAFAHRHLSGDRFAELVKELIKRSGL